MIARVRHFVQADPYTAWCVIVIGVWLASWLTTFPNLYGWLTDDAIVYDVVRHFGLGGNNLIDIQWFHAYMWLIAALPTLLDWTVPSQIMPRAWAHAGEFRALILVTIVLHAVLLGIVAAFLRQICSNIVVCAVAFLLFVTSPVFNFYADLIDSRFLGLLTGVPAVMVLLRTFDTAGAHRSLRRSVLDFGLPGFLMAVGQAIHYTELYLVVPIAAVFWFCAGARARAMGDRRQFKRVAVHGVWFVAGFLAWIVPIQLLSLSFHPFAQSMLGTIVAQVEFHVGSLTRLETLATWWNIFTIGMGVPMIVAAVGGLIILGVPRWRPAYAEASTATIIVWATVIANVYFLLSPTYPFYRQHSGYQIVYCLAATIAIERLVSRLASPARRRAAGIAVLALVAYIPCFVRLPEIFVAQQGLGRAINYANSRIDTNDVVFIDTYDWDTDPKSVTARDVFENLPSRALLITDMPLAFRLRFPDLGARLDATRPIAAFPTLWCTREAYAELQAFFHFRKWYAEPNNCEARVYRVADLRRDVALPAVVPVDVRSTGSLGTAFGPWHVFDAPVRPPRVINAFFGIPATGTIWASPTVRSSATVDVALASSQRLDSIAIVPADYFAPPRYTRPGRIHALQVYDTSARRDRPQLLWSGTNLEIENSILAVFPARAITGLRFVVTALGPPGSSIASIQNISFPGHPVKLPKGAPAVQ